MNEVKNPENEILEKKRENFIKLIEKGISSINLGKKKIFKLKEYKNEIINAKDLPEMLKIWLNVLENKRSGLYESIWYDVIKRNLNSYKLRIEVNEDPEWTNHNKELLDKATKCKKMLLEGIDGLTVQQKWMEPLEKKLPKNLE